MCGVWAGEALASAWHHGRQHKPFLQDLNVLHNLPLQSEYVVFLELIRHNLDKSSDGIRLTEHLDMAVRVRIIDLRGKAPRIVLQEVFEKKTDILSSLSLVDYRSTTWGSASFSVLPLGVAHNDFCRALAERIEEYILVAKYK